jgi:proteasome activator subunit 4
MILCGLFIQKIRNKFSNVFFFVFRKTRLITRDDLTIDWRQLYSWAKVILHNHDEPYSLVSMSKLVFYSHLVFLSSLLSDIENSLFYCVRGCRPYFSATATQEILDEFRPLLCPFDSAFSDTIRIFELFLPVHLPPALHDQGFK